MPTDSVLQVIIRGVDDGARSTIQGVLQDTLGLSDGTAKMGVAMLEATGLALGLSEAFKLLKDGIIGSEQAAQEWQTTLVNVANNTNISSAAMQQLGAMSEQIATQTGASFDSVAHGVEHAMNVTQDLNAAMAITKVATESAISTGADATQVTNLLSNALHEYSLDRSDATSADQRFTDVLKNANEMMGAMHVATAESNTQLAAFTEATSKAVGIGANLGVSYNDIFAATSSLTRHGFPDVYQAGIQVTDMLTHMLNPGQQARDALQELADKSGDAGVAGAFNADAIATNGLTGTIALLKKATVDANLTHAETEQIMLRIIPALRGGLGAAALLGTGYDDLIKTASDLNDQTKINTITQDSFNRSLETTGGQAAVAKANLHDMAIEVGGPLSGAWGILLASFNQWVDGFRLWGTDFGKSANAWDDGLKLMGNDINAVAADIGGPLAGAVQIFDQSVAQWGQGMGVVGDDLTHLRGGMTDADQAMMGTLVASNKLAAGWNQLGDALAPGSAEVDNYTKYLTAEAGAHMTAAEAASVEADNKKALAEADKEAAKAAKDAAKDTVDAVTAITEGQKAQQLQLAEIAHTTALANIDSEKTASLDAITTEKTNYDAAQTGMIAARRARLTDDLAAAQASETAQTNAENNAKRLDDQATAQHVADLHAQETADTEAENKRDQLAQDGFKARTAAATAAYDAEKRLIDQAVAAEDAAEKHRVQVATDTEHDQVQAATDAEQSRVQSAENATNAQVEQIDRAKQAALDAIADEVKAREDATTAAIQQLDREKQATDDAINAEVKARQDQETQQIALLDASAAAQIKALQDQGARLKEEDARRKELERVTGAKGEGTAAADLLTQYYGAIDAGNTDLRDQLAAQISAIDKTLSDLMAADALARQEAALTAQEQAIKDQTTAQKQGLQDQFADFKAAEDAKKLAFDEGIAAQKQALQDSLAAFKEAEDQKKRAVEETAARQVQVLRDTLTQYKQQQADQLRDDTQRMALQLRTYQESQAAGLADFKATEAGKLTAADQARQTTLAQIAADTAAEKQRHADTLARIKETAQTEIDQANRAKQDRDNKLILRQQAEAADFKVRNQQITETANNEIAADTAAQKAKDAEFAAKTAAAQAHYKALTDAENAQYKAATDGINAMAANQVLQIKSISDAWGDAKHSLDDYMAAVDRENGKTIQHAPGKGPQDGSGKGGASGGTGPSGFVPQGDGHDTARGLAAFQAAATNLGSEAWFHDGNTYCEAFAEQMTGLPAMGATARDAWDNWGDKQLPGQVYGGPNLLYFSSDSGAGHVMVGNGSDGIGVLDPPWGVVEESISKFLHDNPGDNFLGSVPLYERGGVVPGPIGQPSLAVVHGGEEFLGVNGERGRLAGPPLDYERLADAIVRAQARQPMVLSVDGRAFGNINRSDQRAYSQTAPANGVGGRF